MKQNNIEILFEDEVMVAINKPSGLLTIPDRYNNLLTSAYSILKEKYGMIYIIHRLDVGTSGILLFAKTSESHSFLSDQFSNHTIRKIYTAVLNGVLRVDTQEIDIPLLNNPNRKGGVIPSSRGKDSFTILNVLDRYKFATLVEAELRTGRLHQLRAHTAAIGYPLLVDSMYGTTSDFKVSSIKRRYNLRKNEEEKPIISRPTMHATRITFLHPNGTEMTIEASFPKDFAALLQVLNKYSKVDKIIPTLE
jgi:23S rRNA pseudouridine955/2504/2580 synthase/23S rRNA pseudouridine1911/1915/1917 synthase